MINVQVNDSQDFDATFAQAEAIGHMAIEAGYDLLIVCTNFEAISVTRSDEDGYYFEVTRYNNEAPVTRETVDPKCATPDCKRQFTKALHFAKCIHVHEHRRNYY